MLCDSLLILLILPLCGLFSSQKSQFLRVVIGSSSSYVFFKSFVSGNMMVSHKLTCDEVNHLRENNALFILILKRVSK